DSTMEAKYVAACEAAKEAVWLRNFLKDLAVVPAIEMRLTIFCYNSGAVANTGNHEVIRRQNTLSENII
ncbi:MAG: hypothetical protein Q8796_02585, partial [Candidatus Phytoplasma australasiaticum]|nr:hypothetical protein [Candidatus Phytoplasma australasiaticum]